jgi:hypothetical protein
MPHGFRSIATCKSWRLPKSRAEYESGRPVMIKLLPSDPGQGHDFILSTPLHVDKGCQCCQVSSDQNEWHITPETTNLRLLGASSLWLVVFDLAGVRSNDLSI